jgi:benzoyl-CoA reductase/2-hydroxyglutaryl-CoA dehydratase subunit BcrC/BadD/HgdB
MSTEILDAFEREEFAALERFKAEGGTAVATFCRFFPPALLTGLGMRGIRILGGATVKAESAGERLIRPDACAWCKTLLGNFLEKSSMHALADAVVGLITCDQMRRTLDRLSRDLEVPVFPVHLPATLSAEAEDYFAGEVQRAVHDLEAWSGAVLDPERVRSDQALRARAARRLETLIGEGRTSPVAAQRLGRLFAWSRPGPFLKLLETGADRLEGFRPQRRIVFVGGVSCEEDDPLFAYLAEREVGVLPLTCTGLSALAGTADPTDVPDEALVDRLARSSFRASPCIRARPNTEVYETIRRHLAAPDVRGVVLKTLPFCDLWFTEKERMKQSLDAPVLVLETGYGEGVRDRILTRLEAFLETLE